MKTYLALFFDWQLVKEHYRVFKRESLHDARLVALSLSIVLEWDVIEIVEI